MGCVAGVLIHKAGIEPVGLGQALLRAMAHRAPDGTRLWSQSPAVLAHGALLATPEACSGLQPLQVDEWVLVVDGRVDDREALAARLQLDVPADAPDEVLWAAAWRRWRHELGHHVVGDFAMAAWHVPSRTLWLLRDRAGVRPLYWVETPDLFAFASEAEALLQLPGISREPDPDRVRYYLASALLDGDPAGSWYRDVRKLRAGHWLKVSEGGAVATGCWWRPQARPPLRLRDDREYQEAFLEVFSQAVYCRLRAPVRPTLMLSGGMDSAAILAMVKRGGDGAAEACQAVSVVSDEGAACPETANILRMHEGLQDAVRLPVPSFDGGVTRTAFAPLPWSPAHPVDNSLLLPMLVYRAVQAAGGRVVLDGMDGDLVMWSRTDRAGRLALRGQWRAAWREARASSRMHTYLQGRHPAGILLRGIASRLQPAPMAALRHRWQARRRELGPWLATEQVLSQRLVQRLAQQRAERHRATHGLGHAEGLAYAWEHAGLFRTMEGMDHLASRFGIEPRHPWCDQRVLDFFLALPEEQVASAGWTKRIARAASEPWLGADVVWHSGKGHLGHHLVAAAVGHEPGRLARLLADEGVLQGWVAPAALAAARGDGGSLPNPMATLHVVTLAAWLAALADGGPGSDLG